MVHIGKSLLGWDPPNGINIQSVDAFQVLYDIIQPISVKDFEDGLLFVFPLSPHDIFLSRCFMCFHDVLPAFLLNHFHISNI